jgi:hypothetical protein
MIRQNLHYYWDYYPHNNASILKPHLGKLSVALVTSHVFTTLDQYCSPRY